MGEQNKDLQDGYEEQETDEQELETNDDSSEEDSPEVEAQKRIDDAVSQMVQNDKGVWEIPDELLKTLSPAERIAVKTTKRHRDTQSAYTKTRQELKKTETVASELEKHVLDTATMHLSDRERDELDELKLRDPDKWRSKLNEYEEKSRGLLQEKLAEINKKGEELSELEIREAQLAAFVENTGLELNDDIIDNELPAKYKKELEEGKVTFDEFLEKAREFLTTPKVVKGSKDEPAKPNPDMNRLSGGREPAQEDQAKDIVKSYDNETY